MCKQPATAFEKIEEKQASSENPYAGTKTEKNLMEAFAGESQARNKYTYLPILQVRKAMTSYRKSSLKRPAMNRSMPGSGIRSWGIWDTPPRICWQQPKEKTMNGRTCMTAWPKTPKKKASRNWQNDSAE